MSLDELFGYAVGPDPIDLDSFLDEGLVIAHRPVGSRVTCSPPPTDTDEDILVLCGDAGKFLLSVEQLGFSDPDSDVEGGHNFHSIRRGDVNLIVTEDLGFYRKFLAASHVSRRLNLLVKADRIALFQAVLYANQWAED